MNYVKLELKLRRIVEKRIDNGYQLTTKLQGVAVGACFCAVGSVVVGIGDEVFTEDALPVFERMGIGYTEMMSISRGFEDGVSLHDLYPDARAIGARICRIYCDDNGVVE